MKKAIVILFLMILLGSCTDEPVPHANNEKIISKENASRRTRKTKRVTDKVNGDDNYGKLTGTQIYDKYKSAVFMIVVHGEKINHQGSGFFIDSNGLALSNYHVFHHSLIGCESIKVGKYKYNVVRVLAESENEDWVLFEVNGDDFSFIPLAKSNPKIGDKVYALGSPKGLENTFSSGEISQIREDGRLLQTSAPIDHGSSGGALIDEKGRVVGITTSKYDDSTANLNFAISIQLIRSRLEK